MPGPLILINLDSADVRRERMTAQLDAQAIPFERVGCDFRCLSRGAIVAWFRERFPSIHPASTALSGAELGCWASHLCAWEAIQGSGHRAGTVLEDDVVLAEDFGTCIRTLEAGMKELDVVYLGTSSRNLSRRRATSVGPLRVHPPVGLVYNTWAYVVSSAWVQRLFGASPFTLTMPVDHFVGGRGRWARPRVGVLQPARAYEDDCTGRDSQIQPHTWRIDRLRPLEALRRRVLSSRASDWYYALYRWL